MEWEGTPCGDGGERGISPLLLEALAGLDAGARQAIAEIIGLYREFPAWAVWLPFAGRAWTAVRPASARAPGPDLPLVWVHAESAARLAGRMRAVDAQLTRWPGTPVTCPRGQRTLRRQRGGRPCSRAGSWSEASLCA